MKKLEKTPSKSYIGRKIKGHLPFRKKKLKETLAEIPGSADHSLWDENLQSNLFSMNDMDDKTIEKLVLEKLHKRAGIEITPESSQLLKSYSKEEKTAIYAELLGTTQNELCVDPEHYTNALSDPNCITIDMIRDLTIQLKLGTRSYIRKFQKLYGMQKIVNCLRWCEYKCSSLWYHHRKIEKKKKATSDNAAFSGIDEDIRPQTKLPSEIEFKQIVELLCHLVRAIIAILHHPVVSTLKSFISIPDSIPICIRILEWCPLSLQGDIFLLIAGGAILQKNQQKKLFDALKRVPLYHQRFFHSLVFPELSKGSNVQYKIAYLTLVNTLISVQDIPEQRPRICNKYISNSLFNDLKNFSLLYPDDALCIQLQLIDELRNEFSDYSEYEFYYSTTPRESSDSDTPTGTPRNHRISLTDSGSSKPFDTSQNIISSPSHTKKKKKKAKTPRTRGKRPSNPPIIRDSCIEPHNIKTKSHSAQIDSPPQILSPRDRTSQPNDSFLESEPTESSITLETETSDNSRTSQHESESSQTTETQTVPIPFEITSPRLPQSASRKNLRKSEENKSTSSLRDNIDHSSSQIECNTSTTTTKDDNPMSFELPVLPPLDIPPPPPGMQPPPLNKKPSRYIPFKINPLPREQQQNSIFNNLNLNKAKTTIDQEFLLQNFLRSNIPSQTKLKSPTPPKPNNWKDEIMSERKEQGIFSVEVILRGFATQEETLSTADILFYLKQGNPESFQSESIEKLISVFPYDRRTRKPKISREEETYRALKPEQVGELTRAQKFLFDLYSLGKPLERLLMMQAQIILSEYIPVIASHLKIVAICMRSFHENYQLKEFLEAVIAASNCLTDQPIPATSMELSSLAKLKNIKTADRKKTLLHVIIEAIQRNNPITLQFPDKIAYLQESYELFPSVYEFSSTCRKELESLKENIEILGVSATHSVILSKLQSDFNKTHIVLEGIYKSMEYFGFSQARSSPLEFFSFWVDFVSTFRISLKWLEDNKFVETQRKRRDAQKMRDNLIQSLVVQGSVTISKNDSSASDGLVELDAVSFRNGIMNLVESSDLHISLRKCAENNSRKIIKRRKRKRNNFAYQAYSKVDTDLSVEESL